MNIEDEKRDEGFGVLIWTVIIIMCAFWFVMGYIAGLPS